MGKTGLVEWLKSRCVELCCRKFSLWFSLFHFFFWRLKMKVCLFFQHTSLPAWWLVFIAFHHATLHLTLQQSITAFELCMHSSPYCTIRWTCTTWTCTCSYLLIISISPEHRCYIHCLTEDNVWTNWCILLSNHISRLVVSLPTFYTCLHKADTTSWP